MSHRIARLFEALLYLLWADPGPRVVPGRPATPYRPARERRARARRQQARRVALWLALHGVDIGPRVIHGRVVAA
ncbi:hypothetical protein ACFYRL_23685 [Streptomyces goshikiensis]|uniref:hypothetical protein n=1 Tax=Streptomyces goshikiensis TaxID=1942 RepID=UPI0036C174E6